MPTPDKADLIEQMLSEQRQRASPTPPPPSDAQRIAELEALQRQLSDDAAQIVFELHPESSPGAVHRLLTDATEALGWLKAERETLIAERDRLAWQLVEYKEEVARQIRLRDSYREELEFTRMSLTAQLAGVREALRTYGLHRDRCALRRTSSEKWPECDCGLTAALTATQARARETETG